MITAGFPLQLLHKSLRQILELRGINGFHVRSSSTHTQSQSATNPPRPKNCKFVIGTLDPRRVRPQDCMDLSSRNVPTIYAALSEVQGHGSIRYQLHRGSIISFPPNTRGFLYYYSPSPETPLAGEVRFRLTQDSSLTDFASGTDLLLGNGVHWRIPLLLIASALRYAPMRALLLRDGLVTPDLVDRCIRLYAKDRLLQRSQILHSLDDTILVDLGRQAPTYHLLLGQDELYRFELARVFYDSRSSKVTAPYTGSAFCRFERTDDNPPRLSLRIPKILEPVKCIDPSYDGWVSMPREGELHVRDHQVWTVDLAAKSAPLAAVRRALQVEREAQQ
ncbi:hypothetical protein BKA93DRAFT_812686 [Sparassis latifolia]